MLLTDWLTRPIFPPITVRFRFLTRRVEYRPAKPSCDQRSRQSNDQVHGSAAIEPVEIEVADAAPGSQRAENVTQID
jgi:hypothetical protein